MTTEYEPGRIYSGIDLEGERHVVMRISHDFPYVWSGGGNAWQEQSLTDVRGPLVVLDAHYYAECNWRDMATHLRSGGWGDIADQIEAQTRPPLKIGWHEVEELNSPRWFDGSRWRSWPHENAPGWLPAQFNSTHFIGRGSGDE